MKTEKQILDKIQELGQAIQSNLKEYNKELERGFRMSANVHWEYHIHLKSFRDTLKWVLRRQENE